MSWHLSTDLRARGYDAVHVRDRGMADASDRAVMASAVEERRVLITRDGDFPRMLADSGHSVPSVLLLRSATIERPEAQLEWVAGALRQCAPQLMAGAIVALKDEQIRVKPLPLAGLAASPHNLETAAKASSGLDDEEATDPAVEETRAARRARVGRSDE